jgi:hypothetical protein
VLHPNRLTRVEIGDDFIVEIVLCNRAWRALQRTCQGRLLLLVPREPRLFEWIEANTRANLHFWVAQVVLPAEVLEG